MKKIGVFVCWCGRNIAQTVDIETLVEAVGELPGVAFASDYKYMCSEPGQKTILDAIKKKELDGIIVAACSPRLHETTFRNACRTGGLNSYQCEIANIREQCSWVHSDKELATVKAKDTIAGLVEKIILNESLSPISVPVTKKALVIGGGISGIHAALNIAATGHPVILVERKASLGGHMRELSETFLSHNSSPSMITAKIAEVKRQPYIRTMTHSTLEDLQGYVGNFKVKILTRPTFVSNEKCDNCGLCIKECPVTISPQMGDDLPTRKAIDTSYPQDVPESPAIDQDHCKNFTSGCTLCADVCPQNAIDFNIKEIISEEDIGAVVIATGYGLYPQEKLTEYEGGRHPDIIDSLQFERMLSVWERSGREIRRPSDGKIPQEVIFIQCAGSRDREKGVPYCSRICCMYTTKHARLYKEAVPGGQAYVFYTDNRSTGKGCEEYAQDAIKDQRILYLRGQVSNVSPTGTEIKVWGEDTLSGQEVEISADLVVLANALVPSPGAVDLAKKLKVSVDENGFFAEVHPKLKPVESATMGIYLAGCAQAPRDIPESISHSLAAAAKVNALFSSNVFLQEPIIVWIDEDLCTGCGICVEACPYGAREIDPWKRTATVIEAVCQGCGACCVSCPSGATQQKNFSNRQLLKMIDASL